MSSAKVDDRVPLTVLTGFLGSGKTTLLSRIVRDASRPTRYAVIENEFSSNIGLENEISEAMPNVSYVGEIYETGEGEGGCICCAGRGDFITVLHALLLAREEFDHIIVETTGMADPTFIQVIFQDDFLSEQIRVDAFVTVVDAANFSYHVEDARAERTDNIEIINEALEQVAVADHILLNKTDLVDAAVVSQLESRLRDINPTAAIHVTSFSNAPLDAIIGTGAFDVDRLLGIDAEFLDYRPFRQHAPDISSVSFMVTPLKTGQSTNAAEATAAESDGSKTALDLRLVEAWLAHVTSGAGASNGEQLVFRAKGVLHIRGSDRRHVMQGVHNSVRVVEGAPWADGEARTSRFVFVGRNLDVRNIAVSFTERVSGAGRPLALRLFQEDTGYYTLGDSLRSLTFWGGVGLFLLVAAAFAFLFPRLWIGWVVDERGGLVSPSPWITFLVDYRFQVVAGAALLVYLYHILRILASDLSSRAAPPSTPATLRGAAAAASKATVAARAR